MIMGLSKEDIKVKLGSEKNCVQDVTVEWPAAKVKEEIENAFEGIKSKAQLPGFRQGKTPPELIRKNFKDTAYARAQDALMREGVTQAIKLKKINAIQAPVVQSMKFDPEKSFQFEFKVEVAPQFKLSSYKGFKLTQKSDAVEESAIEAALKNIQDSNSRLVESKDEKVGKNHFVTINYEGFIKDKPIEGAKAENFLMDMSAPQAIEGLSDGILGAKTNDEKDVTVTFPKESPSKELAGKKAVFKIKVVAIKEKQSPKLDDDFAKDLGLKSLDELKGKVRTNLETERKRHNRKDIEEQVVSKLLDANKFKVPQSLIDNQVKHLNQRQAERMAYQGIPKEEQDKVKDRLQAEITAQAEKDVRLAFILNSIADGEKVEVKDADVQARVDEIVSQTEDKQKEAVKTALKGAYLDKIRSELKDTKLFDLIISYGKVKKVSGGKK